MTNNTLARAWEMTARSRAKVDGKAVKAIGRLFASIDCGQMTAQQADSEFRVLLTIDTIKTTVKPTDKHSNKVYNLASQYDAWISECSTPDEYTQTITEAFNVFDRACVLVA